jgi:serine/threonine-protein kinase
MPVDAISIDAIQNAFTAFSNIVLAGTGGQKCVYRAVDTNGQVRAIKLIKGVPANSDNRAQRELDISLKLQNAYFARIYSHGKVEIAGEAFFYIIEDFIDGNSLRQLLTGPLALVEVQWISREILSAINFLGCKRLVHRDIKPENIIVSTNPQAIHIVDFGIARVLDKESLTADCAFFGPMTAGYCAPEQAVYQKRAIGWATDLFACGVNIYEMVTGANPFLTGAFNANQVLERVLSYSPPSLASLGHSQTLSQFVSRCMEKSLHRRYSTPVMAEAAFTAIEW